MVDNVLHGHHGDNQILLSPCGSEWVVMRSIYYSLAGYVFCVSKGFTTDLASIPRLAKPLISVHGSHTKGAILHDFLYRYQPVSRKIADQLFLRQMKLDGVGRIKRYTIYNSLRLGGWVVYNKHKRSNKRNRDKLSMDLDQRVDDLG